MAGRPTLYSEEMITKAQEYLRNLPQDEVVHSIEGLADFINVDRKTIYNWSETYDEFFHIVEQVLKKQAKKLANKGLTGEFNASITKLMLTKHGYSDKQEVDQNLNAKVETTITGMRIINDGIGVQDQKPEATQGS